MQYCQIKQNTKTMQTSAKTATIYQALEDLNRIFNGNIEIRGLSTVSKNRVKFTLNVKNSSGKGAKVSPSGRRTHFACWHANGLFFDFIFRYEPTAIIKVGNKKITILEGNWEDFYIGPAMAPIKFSDCCSCHIHSDVWKAIQFESAEKTG